MRKTPPEMRSSRVTALFESDDGALWIGHESGAITKFKNGKFHAQENVAGQGGVKIFAFTADESGAVWFLNEAGQLVRVGDGLVLTPPAGRAKQLLSIGRDSSGKI